MSLIRCFECKKKISNIVDVCPHCGYPMSKDFIKDFNEIEKQIKKQEKLGVFDYLYTIRKPLG